MSNQHPQYQQQPYPKQPVQPPKKKHTVRNVVLGVVIGGVLLIGGCTALVGGALSSVDTSTDKPDAVSSTVDTGPTPDPIITPTNKPTKTTQPPAKPKVTKPSMTKSQEQAIGAAKSYLEFTAFSRKGLIRQLSSEAGDGFSVADATFAVDHIKVNWNEQAAKAAKSYLEMTHFSRQGLIHQLESDAGDGFTHRQAVYGVTKAGL